MCLRGGRVWAQLPKSARVLIVMLGRWLVAPLLTMVAVSVVLYFAVALAPGDPVTELLGPHAAPSQRAVLRRQLGLDQPLPVRYWEWFSHAVRGNFGASFTYKQGVAGLIEPRLAITLMLIAYATVIIIAVGVPLGVIGGISDRLSAVTAALSGLASSIPGFFAAEVLIAVFAIKLQLLPAIGAGTGIVDGIAHLTLPAISLAIAPIAYVSQVTRSAVREQALNEHVEGAKARGLPPVRVLRRYILRNAAVPIVTASGLTIASLFAGAVVIEQAFGLGGVGSVLVQAVSSKDQNVVLALGLIIAAVFIVTTTFLDFLHYLIDPRVRQERRALS
jgi:peptide/nickel transport system permease protein